MATNCSQAASRLLTSRRESLSMKKCLIFVQVAAVLAFGSGCIVVPGHHRTVVHHTTPPRIHHHQPAVVVRPPPAPVVRIETPVPVVPPPVIRIEAPQPVVPPPVVVVRPPKVVIPAPVVRVEAPKVVVPPPVVVVEQPKHRPTPAPHVVAVKAREKQWTQVIINPQERGIIREYVVSKKSHGHGQGSSGKPAKHDKGLPKGIAKKVERGDDLPPGWQRKCVKGQIMPTEIYQRCEPLPHEVVVKLPPPPSGTIIVTIEGKAVRLMQATLEILDVFDVL
jgi:hypothetical protein